MLTGRLVEAADYIFGMTHSHVDSVTLLFPHAAEKTFLLREFDETLDEYEKDISDPIGGSFETYAYTRDQIEQGIYSMFNFLEQSGGASAPRRALQAVVALGADHAGFRLKELLKQHLEGLGVPVSDQGTHSAEPADYPDYARLVAQSVADRKCDFGLLVCGTGIGMSITANKIPGVRAALVFNEEMAALSRQHNNANVLCIGARITPPEEAKKILSAFLTAQFEGGRHERRVNKMESTTPSVSKLKTVDPEIANAIFLERQRQQDNIELIASENFVSPAVHGSAGLGPDQQIRRRLPGQALVWRL